MEKWSHVLIIFLIPETARDNCGRPMSRQEIEENFEFFEALEQERRTDKLGWLVLSLVWLAVFGVLLILIYFGVIPFCNL